MLAGVAGSLLLAVGAFLLRELPSTGASAMDVYAYFLDHRDAVTSGTAALLGGLALLIPFLATVRVEERVSGRGPSTTSMLAAGVVAVLAGTFAAALVGGLAVGAENADPGSSRTLLDVAQTLGAAAGPLFAVAILSAAAGAYGDNAPAWIPLLWVVCALACLLWLGPLVNDAAITAYGSVLGTYAGVAGLIAWTATSAILARRPDPRLEPQ